ncbi:MAG: hypothetical protein RLZZ435_395 [Cyanobacteriota bacterium]
MKRAGVAASPLLTFSGGGLGGNSGSNPDCLHHLTHSLHHSAIKGYQLKAEECGASRRTLPLNFSAFSGKPYQAATVCQKGGRLGYHF